MKNTYATAHGLNRMKERCNIKNDSTLDRVLQLAYERGKTSDDFTSSQERSFLEQKSSIGCTALAYNNYCFIMNKYGGCVTVYELPSWFGKKGRYNGKEPIRNYKKYYKNHNYLEQYEWIN